MQRRWLLSDEETYLVRNALSPTRWLFLQTSVVLTTEKAIEDMMSRRVKYVRQGGEKGKEKGGKNK